LRGGQARLFVEASFATCRRLALTTRRASSRLRLHADGMDDLSVPHDAKGSALYAIVTLTRGAGAQDDCGAIVAGATASTPATRRAS